VLARYSTSRFVSKLFCDHCVRVFFNIARQVIFWASLFATWCIDIPMCYYLGLVKGLGLKALWYSIFMMEVCRFVSKVICFAPAQVAHLLMAGSCLSAIRFNMS
jgi:hypothetical protein